MKFKNTASSAITFDVALVPMKVEAGAVFEVADKHAFALALMGLPVEEYVEPPPEAAKPEPKKK